MIPCGMLRVLPNASRFSCGRRARRSEFYGPLSATGGRHRAEPGALRARQLQPLVRPRASDNPIALVGEPLTLELR